MEELKLVKKLKPKIIINNKPVNDFMLFAGPCAVESLKQLSLTAKFLKKYNITALRAMIFKPRTSPYSFQGLGKKGIKILKEIKKLYNIPLIIEILDIRDIGLIKNISDVIQIGARNMQNFPLLKEVGKLNKPVILKRGLAATLKEWLSSAEYILSMGNEQVILCERGIRSFSRETRFTLDISIVPLVKKITKLPIIVDPSHASGTRDLVIACSRASKAAGADGLIIEVHPNPNKAKSDNKQQLTFELFEKLIKELKEIKYYKNPG